MGASKNEDILKKVLDFAMSVSLLLFLKIYCKCVLIDNSSNFTYCKQIKQVFLNLFFIKKYIFIFINYNLILIKL